MAITDRPKLVLALSCALAISSCGSSSSRPRIADTSSRTYRDPAGWTIQVPPGWRVARFTDARGATSVAGAVISNMRLPAPDLVRGYPIQINGRVLPRRGIGLVIANDPSRSLSIGALPSPPLPSPDGKGDQWSIGSAPSASPYLETLQFRRAGTTFVASAKIGAHASRANLRALASVITSLR